jgi:hypothetical protein
LIGVVVIVVLVAILLSISPSRLDIPSSHQVRAAGQDARMRDLNTLSMLKE